VFKSFNPNKYFQKWDALKERRVRLKIVLNFLKKIVLKKRKRKKIHTLLFAPPHTMPHFSSNF